MTAFLEAECYKCNIVTGVRIYFGVPLCDKCVAEKGALRMGNRQSLQDWISKIAKNMKTDDKRKKRDCLSTYNLNRRKKEPLSET